MGKGKIVFLKSSSSGCGGLEKYTKCLCEAFSARGHQVTLLTTHWNSQIATKGFRVVDFGRKSKWSLRHLMQFDRDVSSWLSDNHVDVVFGLARNFYPQTFYRAGNGCHTAYLHHRKHFSSAFKRLTIAMNPLHWLICRMEKETFLHPQLRTLFTNSQLVKREILEHYPEVDPDKIKVVLNGVEWKGLEIPFEESLQRRSDIQRSLDLDPDAYQFLFVGHEYQRKGLGLLLEALSSIKDRPFQLSVVGKEKNEASFKKRAKELGLEEKVHFFGPQKEVTRFYQAADTCVIPSYYDPFANVTVEALAMGLFVVSSLMNGGSEVIFNEKMGCVFREFRPEVLARTLTKAMNFPKSSESARSIRQKIEHLDFAHQIESIVSEVEEIL
ncbi:MAG TPA: glycosyltransferase family 4 protein [Chlamydiales bacterium]|nr:glycosyltransferase family 4 protein [Chlamydiales bacterium]